MKPELYDVLVELPHPDKQRIAKPMNKSKLGPRSWPLIKHSSGVEIKATQRDLRRYKLLRRALTPLSRLRHGHGPENGIKADAEDNEQTHLLYQNSVASDEEEEAGSGEEKLAEPTSWSALAYSSFMWWASAGEKEEGLAEEEEQDHKLISDLGELARNVEDLQRYRDNDQTESEAGDEERQKAEAQVELGVISFFHRVTKQLFEACVEILDEHSGNEDSDAHGEDEAVGVGSGELRRCGLDVWSEADGVFVADFVEMWFERAVEVHGMGIDCCGMRIC
jgi:hypothetical protein